ncbi:aminoglycoside phosphotransferase family protein [Serinicoccus sp. LYQ131]|uniref:aminoglycoside phosphotransferase family protein n=1 Tax=Serinicoccus sp. LYQ131 TaxID=3378797 RepID=UPI0038540140
MITAEDLVREGTALSDRFGRERADAFGQSLPGLVDRLRGRWGLRPQGLYPSGATSVVLAVEAEGHGPAVLKVSPDAAFLTRQSRMLQHLAATGRAPTVLVEAPEDGAVLLERIVPGHTLDSTRGEPPTPPQWASLLQDLHRTDVDGVSDTLADRCEDMVDRIGARQALPQVRTHVPDSLWQRVVADCRDLIRTGTEQVVIHGDLHLGNVLDGGDRGLVVIDPKLCVGDRCFDMVDYVVTEGDAARMRTRAAELAPLVGMDLDRLLGWCAVNAVVTAISHITWSGSSARTDELLLLAGHS